MSSRREASFIDVARNWLAKGSPGFKRRIVIEFSPGDPEDDLLDCVTMVAEVFMDDEYTVRSSAILRGDDARGRGWTDALVEALKGMRKRFS